MTDIHSNPAYKEGMRDCEILGGKYQNPYELNSKEYNLYERGWFQIKNRPSEEILDQLCKKLGISPNEKGIKIKKKPTTKEDYLRKKG